MLLPSSSTETPTPQPEDQTSSEEQASVDPKESEQTPFKGPRGQVFKTLITQHPPSHPAPLRDYIPGFFM